MILIIGDVHSRFEVINQQIEFAEQNAGTTIEAVIVLGDMGIYSRPLERFFANEKQRFNRPVYFIEGNHEEFSIFDRLVDQYKDFMTYLPRGQVTQICGIRFLSLGGACYMDALNSPSGSEIKHQDIAKCLNHAKEDVSIIITHDCPKGIGVPNSPGLEFYGEPGFEHSQDLLKHFAPQIWFFGHHHRWFNSKAGNTMFHGLPESWKGFGLLNDQMQFTAFDHLLPIREGWFQKLLKKLLG